MKRLDVREEIRAGREPFGKIMAAVRGLEPGQDLCLQEDGSFVTNVRYG